VRGVPGNRHPYRNGLPKRSRLSRWTVVKARSSGPNFKCRGILLQVAETVEAKPYKGKGAMVQSDLPEFDMGQLFPTCQELDQLILKPLVIACTKISRFVSKRYALYRRRGNGNQLFLSDLLGYDSVHSLPYPKSFGLTFA